MSDEAIDNIFEEGSVIANRYEVVDVLGAGGMGWVVKTKDRELQNQIVALKILYPHLLANKETAERFFNELLITRKLSHPNIVQTYCIETTENETNFISMEYVEGITLKEFISSAFTQPTKLVDLGNILYRIAGGISFAHGCGVVHCDLKPDNVIISTSGDVKILDFGISQFVRQEKGTNNLGAAVGTPYYMAPEQFQGKPLTIRTDVYCFGILAYELLIGTLPFSGNSFYDLAEKHLNQAIEFPVNTPEWCKEFIRKCTEKSPKDRFSSFKEIKHILSQQFNCKTVEEDEVNRSFVIDGTWLETKNVWRRPQKEAKTFLRIFDPLMIVTSICTLLLWLNTWHSAYLVASLAAVSFIFMSRLKRNLTWIGVFLAAFAISIFVMRTNPASNKRVMLWLVQAELKHELNLSPMKSLFNIPTQQANVDMLIDSIRAGLDKKAVRVFWALVRSGLDLNENGTNGFNALHIAVQQKWRYHTEELLSHGANPNSQDLNGNTPLHYAVNSDDIKTVQLLLKSNADPNLGNNVGETPLSKAVELSEMDLVLLLLQSGGDINYRTTETKQSLLHLCAKLQSETLCKFLLKRGIALNTTDSLGQTALHSAVLGDSSARGYLSILRSLLASEINTKVKDGLGKTAIDYARELGRNDIIKLIRKSN